MEIYNPMLDKKEESSSKSKMEILTEYILEELNSYIEDEKRLYRYTTMFNGFLPGVEKETLDEIIKCSKDLIKALITNDVNLFIQSASRFGMDGINNLPRGIQEKVCKNFRLELYKNAEKALENK